MTRLLNQYPYSSDYIALNGYRQKAKRQDEGGPNESVILSTPFHEISHPWWDEALKALKTKYNTGDPNHDLLMKYNLLMNYIFKLNM